eukprot:CAMPEP_0198326668 /NCGR_PEP_ID=MMETSP1450-20131203/14130_1 /TAXON_ID=753684 ORGANISM="Madagascaria erythrocladiodes, Strain CCMP3234" /NCGR_SAMPLE_ID=MMETSP1450 /ASSEMBLY_ACC=CAM_ASM_001115 /LENGTH=151 /DNA_ID=CAMNT_0044030645 /DNA_START=541 /DNA_END=996 /DNA_ORIENTATION=-
MASVYSIFVALGVSIAASIPGWMAAGVVIYLEYVSGSLNEHYLASGWYSQEIYPEAETEHTYVIRRVHSVVTVSTTNTVRPVYVVVPILLSILEWLVELWLVLRHYKKDRSAGPLSPQTFYGHQAGIQLAEDTPKETLSDTAWLPQKENVE